MNLVAYDKISNRTDKTKTWIDTKKGIILSREINRRKYYTYVKRFDPQLCLTIYFLVLLDDNPGDRQVYRTKTDDYGRLKFSINPIASEYGLYNLDNGANISLSHIESADDGDIYRFNL